MIKTTVIRGDTNEDMSQQINKWLSENEVVRINGQDVAYTRTYKDVKILDSDIYFAALLVYEY